MSKEKINTLLIGVGYHSKRIYVPYLKESTLCNFVACLDLLSQKEKVDTFFEKQGISIATYYTDDNSISDELSCRDTDLLNSVVRKFNIEAVVISTEPLSHFKYTKWALENNLHVLLDKPITTEIDVSTDTNKAEKLYQDYERLADLYIEKTKKLNLVFNIQAQRRFHAGFQAVREKIVEMVKISHCPVTSIQTSHSDGQWTFPNEFIHQTYHPYNKGYGKVSHSGYHSLDIALWLAKASLENDKQWDNFKLYSQFVRPSDVLGQFNREDYVRIFPHISNTDLQLDIEKDVAKITGEVDAFTNIALRRGEYVMTSIVCSILHNSLSQRGWFDSVGRNLYKGNGRIRQESYIIEQGPFQSIVINSFQSQEIQKKDLAPYSFGGEYHFDIYVFRNKNMFPDLLSYEFLNMQNLRPVEEKGYSRGHQEDARRNCVENFYKSIINQIPTSEQKSNIIDHGLTTHILSSIYNSAAKQYTGGSGVIQEIIRHK